MTVQIRSVMFPVCLPYSGPSHFDPVENLVSSIRVPMQKYSQSFVVLPCHSLEDFPIHHRGSQAAELLANWTALWHPALIAATEQKPDWHPADVNEFEFDNDAGVGDATRQDTTTNTGVFLVLIPGSAEAIVDPHLLTNLETHSAIVIKNQSSRAEIIETALNANEHAQTLAKNVDEDLALDFLALGYAFLQVQLMTRQLRYSSNLDEKYFSESVAAAAKLATTGKTEECRQSLGRCFDLLLDEKNGYYPVEPELLDVVLTAPTTLGNSLNRQLDVAHRFNLLLTGAVCEQLASSRPETANKIQRLIAEEKINVIGGLQDELPDSLISTESALNQFQTGIATLEKQLAARPRVFMRRKFGLTPSTPGLLDQFDFIGAIHATLDDGKFPNSSSSNIRWTGVDDRSVLAIGDVPLSAADPGSFLGLGVRLGEAIDSAHIATALFVHWPSDNCESFDDLIRISNYGTLLGNFVGIEEYFESVYDPGYGDTFAADEYKAPFLTQAVEQHSLQPISVFTKYWRRFYQLSACRAVLTQACASSGIGELAVSRIQDEMDLLQSRIESALGASSPEDSDIDTKLESIQAELEAMLSPGSEKSRPENKATKLVNPTSFKRVVEIKSGSIKTGTLKRAPLVRLCDSNSEDSHWVVELPPMGSTTLDLATPKSKDDLKSDPKIGEQLILRNEFFELQVDDQTGGIRAINLYGNRVNLAGQQIAIRIPGQQESDQPRVRARYTKMVADEINLVLDDSRLTGTIVSKGRLLDSDSVIATFGQTVRVTRGQRVIDVKIDIDLHQPLTQSVNHYVCSRLAWKSEASRIIANAAETRQEINTDWFQATNFIEILQDENRLTMLTDGLPFHRRASRRMVDSLLIVGDEQQRQFKFGLGVNAPYAMATAVSRLTPPWKIELPGGNDGKNSSDRLFHFDRKNILVTWWQPFFETVDETASIDDRSQWSGIRLRLRETEGRAGTLNISCPRPIATGEQVNFVGKSIGSLDLAEDDPNRLTVEFRRFDYFQISIRWKL